MNFFKPKFWDKNKISFLSIVLYPIALIIKSINFLKKKITKDHIFSTPIICVGNIYLGGTGKTPFCIELFSLLKSLNKNPSFIRKDYKSYEDEVILLNQVGVVYKDKKRLNAIKKAISNKSDVLILDDGFQDFSIKKKISIICFNEKQWIGNGLTIPAGPLREELSSLKRANYVIINGKKNIDIETKILKRNKNIKIFYTLHHPENIDKFKNKNVLAFAGIGAPENFINLLKDYEINIVKENFFPDHHIYSDREIDELIIEAKKNNAVLLTTEKDYVKLKESYKKNINFLKIKTKIKDQEKFISEIKKIL